jgi:excisionase family DNA binding protein
MTRFATNGAIEMAPLTIEDLPLTAPIDQVAKVLGFTCGQVRSLVNKKKIAHIKLGSRFMIPRDAIERYLLENTVQPCHDATPGPASASSKSEIASTSFGQKAVAAVSVQRALQIADSLKQRLPNSSTLAPEQPARVIPLRS